MVASSRIAIVASAFAVGASAAVINRRQQQDNGWLATDYQWGCSPGGCSSQFNLLGFEGVPSGAPAFDVVCSPIYIQQDWIACKNRDGSTMAPESVVYAVWKAGPDNDKQYINIAHVYYRQEDGLYYDAESASAGFLPEKGGTEWFSIATVNPASESHLPPVVNTDAPTQTVQADTETGIPDLVNAEDPVATSTDGSVPDPVPAAGEDIPTPDPTEDPANDPTPTDDGDSTPAEDPTPAADPTPESTPESTPSEDPVPAGDGPSNTVTSDMPDGVVLSQPLQSDVVLSQPLLNPVPGTGTIPAGGNGA
ncbi:Cell surface glycoprotein 1 [Colletotrichum sp. SAR 10_77]|nr:Cell surface glycoprotein 1 [Colletotrichum sp. SAR 10_75]KAI8247604.1 Cell surface glycoprotein 1 [Colletotrichum sp. SAR 10_77]